MPLRLAAAVILLREGNDSPELLFVRRTPLAHFMGGYWVFPGGAVDPEDGEGRLGLRAAAVRELREEAAITLAPGAELIQFSRWITPPTRSTRFDTWFHLAHAPAGASPEVDGSEIVDFRWLTPIDALSKHAANEITLAGPTASQLQQLSAFGSVAQLLKHARGSELVPVPPVVGRGEHSRIMLPGDPVE